MNNSYALYTTRWLTPFNVHPLYAYVIAYMFGICMQAQECMLLGSILLTITCGVSLLYTHFYKRMILFCILFFAAGAYRFYVTIEAYKNIFVFQSKEQPLWGTGTVCDISPHNHVYFKQKISLALNTLGTENETAHAEPCKGVIHLFAPEHDRYAIDDVITLHNLYLQNPRTKRDLIERTKDGVIALHFKTKKSRLQKRSARDSAKRYLFNFKMTILTDAIQEMNQAAKTLYATLFLGNKKLLPLPATTTQQFNTWGISHHLARSGLHMVIVIWLWSLCIHRIPCSTSIKHGTLIALGLLYYFFSWPTLSFNRACFAFFLFHICSWNKIRLDALQAVAWATLCFLFVCPAHLFALDFQLSFGLTHALALFNHTQTKLTPNTR